MGSHKICLSVSRLSHLPRKFGPRTMFTAHNTNHGCCSNPAVPSDYQPKGTIKPFGDFKHVYITGPVKSDNALVCVYDIFGYLSYEKAFNAWGC